MTERQNTQTENNTDKPESKEESFADLFSKIESKIDDKLKQVIKGKVVAVNDNMALVDVGLKSEGWIPLSEFSSDGSSGIPMPGDEVEVYIDKAVSYDGQTILSRVRARREESWKSVEECYEKGTTIIGYIRSRVRGGYTVDIDGAQGFLPGSQVDIRPVRDMQPLMDTEQPFRVLKINRLRGNIVVSRRAVMEESRAEKRDKLYSNLSEGQTLEGVVKNITDYGAFVDLGGIDGLVHVTDILWKRVNHASEVLSIGDDIHVKVLSYNRNDGRVSLGMKQLSPDPWEGIEHKYPKNAKITAKVTSVTDYGAFVELEEGVEGLVHVSEMSWTKKNINPNKILKNGQDVELMVLEINVSKRRVSLGMRQCTANPYQDFAERHNVGDVITGKISSITDFGIFVSLDSEIDGMVHISDLTWDSMTTDKEKSLAQEYKKGQELQVKLLEIAPNKERISLGIKQLTEDPLQEVFKKYKKGTVHTCIIEKVTEAGILVNMLDDGGIKGFIKRNELSRNRADQRSERFAAGEKQDAKIIGINRSKRELSLSIKSMETEEMNEALEAYGSADSGARLGEILGKALEGKAEQGKDSNADAKKPAKKPSSEDAVAGKKADSKPAKTANDADKAKKADVKEAKDSKETKDSKDSKDSKPAKTAEKAKEAKKADVKEAKETKETKDSKPAKVADKKAEAKPAKTANDADKAKKADKK